MQRANHNRSTAIRVPAVSASAVPPPVECVAEASSSRNSKDMATTDVLLSPAGTFVSPNAVTADHNGEHRRQLAIAIRQRIESRLAGRVRDLAVRIVGDTVVIEGRCSTYYSKQLAQHAALGVLENEQLENAIVVAVPA